MKPRDDTFAAWLECYDVPELRFHPQFNLILREPDVAAFSGLPRTTRHELIAKGEFPATFGLTASPNSPGKSFGTCFLQLLIWKLYRMRHIRGSSNEVRDIREAIIELRKQALAGAK
jgi:hypothetical protein